MATQRSYKKSPYRKFEIDLIAYLIMNIDLKRY